LLVAPFASLSYAQALALWWISSIAIYAFCCFSVWRICPNLGSYGSTVLALAVGFPAFFHLIAWGQTSAFALACFTVFYFLIRKRWDFLAGLALGCLIFKPQLGLAAAILFVSIGSWKVVGGALFSALGEISIGILYYGLGPLRSWLHTLWNIRDLAAWLEPRPYQTHCLRTFWSMLIPWDRVSFGLYIISAVVVLGWTIWIWKRSPDWRPRYTLLLLATVLVAPHLTVYDLVILAPAFLLTADWLLAQPRTHPNGLIGTVLYLVYMLPLVGPYARWTHIQLSVVAMGSLAYLIGKGIRLQNSLQRPELAEAGKHVSFEQLPL